MKTKVLPQTQSEFISKIQLLKRTQNNAHTHTHSRSHTAQTVICCGIKREMEAGRVRDMLNMGTKVGICFTKSYRTLKIYVKMTVSESECGGFEMV